MVGRGWSPGFMEPPARRAVRATNRAASETDMERRIIRGWLVPLAIATGAAWAATIDAGQMEPVFDPGNFVSGVDHPFFPLRPGTTFSYRAETADGIETEQVTVMRQTKTIM